LSFPLKHLFDVQYLHLGIEITESIITLKYFGVRVQSDRYLFFDNSLCLCKFYALAH